MSPSTHRNFAFAYRGDLILSYATSGSMRADTFNAFLPVFSLPQIRYSLGLNTGNFMMSGYQRHRVSLIAREKNMKFSVLTDSRITRGLLTAFSWLGMDLKSYPTTQIQDALLRLEQNEEDIKNINFVFSRLAHACQSNYETLADHG